MPVGADGGDSPAWSRKRGPYVPPAIDAARPTRCPTPSCTRTRRSRSSTGPPRPRSSPKRRERLGLHALAVTDHDGFYGIVRFAEAAETLQREDRLRRRALARAAASRRTASPIPRARTCSCSPAARRATTGSRPRSPHAQLRGAEKGRPVVRPRRARRAGRRALGGADRMPQGRRAPGARRRRARGRGARARPAGRAVRARMPCTSSSSTTATRSTRATTTLLAGLAAERGLPLLATQQRALRRPRSAQRLAAAVAAVRANRSLDELDGWLPAHAGRAPALGRRDGGALRALPRRRRAHGDARRRARLPAAPRQARAAASRRCPRGTRRCRGCGSWCGRRCRASTPTSTDDDRARIEKRARRHRAEGLPRLLPDRARHRAGGAAARHPVPGSRLGRQQRRSATCSTSPRSTRSSTSCRSSGSSRRLRDEEPDIDVDFDSDRREEIIQWVYATVRARARGAGRERHPVPAEERRARHGEGARALARASRTPGRSRSSSWGATLVDRAGPRHPRPGDRVRVGAAEGAAASRHPLRRHGAHRPARRRGRADRARPHGEPHGDPVGQGRRRLDGAREVRPARARDAGGPAVLLRPHPRGDGRGVGARDDPEGGEGGLRHAVPGRLDRGVPGRVAARRWGCCRACSRGGSTTS